MGGERPVRHLHPGAQGREREQDRKGEPSKAGPLGSAGPSRTPWGSWRMKSPSELLLPQVGPWDADSQLDSSTLWDIPQGAQVHPLLAEGPWECRRGFGDLGGAPRAGRVGNNLRDCHS